MNPYDEDDENEHAHSHLKGDQDWPVVLEFLRQGMCVPPLEPSLSLLEVEMCTREIQEQFDRALDTLAKLGLREKFEKVGFTNFKLRDKGRYDLVIDAFLTRPEFSFLREDAPWMPLIKKLLGDDSKCIHTGVMFSTPGSETQAWHSDGPHLSRKAHLPPHAINVFLPLVDMTVEKGPTEFVPGSHIEWRVKNKPVAPCPLAGQILLMDYRIKHRGLGNKSQSNRPLVYITYAKKGWKDKRNFSQKRYGEPLPSSPSS